MTKFEKLTQAIENMTGKTIKPEQIKRSKLVMELGCLRQDLGFLQPDIRYKWNPCNTGSAKKNFFNIVSL